MKTARKTNGFPAICVLLSASWVRKTTALVGVVGNEQGAGTTTSAAGNVFAHSGFTVSLCKGEREKEGVN